MRPTAGTEERGCPIDVQYCTNDTQQIDGRIIARKVLVARFCRETPAFMFRRASSSIKSGQTGSDSRRSPGILTPIFVAISRRIRWTRDGYNEVQRISFRDKRRT
jgi:hypothetical protein